MNKSLSWKDSRLKIHVSQVPEVKGNLVFLRKCNLGLAEALSVRSEKEKKSVEKYTEDKGTELERS